MGRAAGRAAARAVPARERMRVLQRVHGGSVSNGGLAVPFNLGRAGAAAQCRGSSRRRAVGHFRSSDAMTTACRGA
ncbi:MAG: hypothetical protein KGO01_22005, partial [Burkholderiales bacterium]|nr:hypothetical protein [Burkholderiales bacterium]